MTHSEKHCFALYCPTLATHLEHLTRQNGISLINPELWNRITNILRLKHDDHFQLFDGNHCVTIQLDKQTFATKKMIVGTVLEVVPLTPLTPTITVYQGLTKKEAFEDIVYAAAQLGVTHLQPIICDKTQRAWYGDKELIRVTSIMTAACEQSKQFALPSIQNPITFEQALGQTQTKKPFACAFETDGKKLSALLDIITAKPASSINLFIGPEGGFSDRELDLFNDHKVERYRLTPTVLRSQEAFLVGVGVLRSITAD
ncbi:MAG: RsmE family RNA methyltransferase [Candidatus Babeliales bacterium]